MTVYEPLPRRTRASVVQRALAHPLRAAMLVELSQGVHSPSQLAEKLRESVGVCSYHVRVLCEAGLVELVGVAPKRGALQHFYRATGAEPVGTSLMLTPGAADQLVNDIRAAIERAKETPGDASVVVVAHREA